MDTNNDTAPLDEAFLDAAAAQAVGAHTAEEAAAFQTRLAAASAAERRVLNDLQAVVAKMAAASPYLEPDEALRGKILEATAPANFKMEQYRRSNDMAKWQRWGLIAAILFLVLGAGYNAMLQQAMGNQAKQMVRMDTAIRELRDANARQLAALDKLVDPDVHQVNLVDKNNKAIGKLLVDNRTKEFMLVMPQTVIPPGAMAKIVVEQNGQRRELVATAVGAMPGSRSAAIGSLATPLEPGQPVNVGVGGTQFAGTGLR